MNSEAGAVPSVEFRRCEALGPMGVESFRASVSASTRLVRLSDENGAAIRLNVHEAAALRAWLNTVLPEAS